eukprot:TRINITY_DN82436_c0_g1_i1.p1 TRINITY_DN82436_c0_g1~~TRINITY_DN82436_c0_g1_i1.p1  ORF type:complete len:433 (+),score=134.34 TRINITY_DN82436_c0_g1_i1:50-1300(+)
MVAGCLGEDEEALGDDEEEEEQLKAHCEELEARLRQDALSFENEALEVQLAQMQDDYAKLQEEFRSMREYFGRRITDMNAQLEERARMAMSAEGHADCLRDLLNFHEDNGKLAGSYWRAQCEKRDDSIRFLSLKLKEYTVPSAEYRARQRAEGSASSMLEPLSPTTPKRPAFAPGRSSGKSSPKPSAMSQSGAKAAERALQELSSQHACLCQGLQVAEEEAAVAQQELEASELTCAELRAATRCWIDGGTADEADAEDEFRLRQELEASSQAFAELGRRGQLPTWAQRCAWRDELDIRAGQLERISLQFDATKRSLDAANEELQWQATSAEALRMRLADVLRAASAEERRSQEVAAEEEKRIRSLRDLLQRWSALRPEAQLPPVCQQAKQLLESISKEDSDATKHAVTSSDPSTST